MDVSRTKKLTLRFIGLVGATLFLLAFSFTFSIPDWVERFAADYIESEARERLEQTIDDLEPPAGESALARFAQTLLEANEDKVREWKTMLKLKMDEQWADALAKVRDLSCECRQKYEELFREGLKSNVALVQAANDRIVDFIHSTYMEVTNELKRDIRIFTGSNAAVFLLLLAVSFAKPQAMVHLFVPAILLTISTIACTYGYIFEQNWLLTIIHSDYLGIAYLGWLGVVFLFLRDIVLNRGRVTTEIVNAILNAIGSAASVVPC
ncbi:MAG: hypothetical protein AAFX44_02635 [Pseudomonadota bacterium]